MPKPAFRAAAEGLPRHELSEVANRLEGVEFDIHSLKMIATIAEDLLSLHLTTHGNPKSEYVYTDIETRDQIMFTVADAVDRIKALEAEWRAVVKLVLDRIPDAA